MGNGASRRYSLVTRTFCNADPLTEKATSVRGCMILIEGCLEFPKGMCVDIKLYFTNLVNLIG